MMGHNRLGRLPKTLRWREVVALLHTSPELTDQLAAAVVRAAERRLRALADDPALGYSVWMLARITWAARSERFLADLERVGINAPADASALGLIAEVGDRVRREISSLPTADSFGEISSQALRQALTETVALESRSLFGSGLDDLQRAFRSYSTPDRFGELARRYFSAFMSRSLRAFLDREIANHVGRGYAIGNVESSAEVLRELDRHVWQQSKIVEDFAGGWYSKHNWESKGQISAFEAQQFTAVALRKLRSELRAGERA